MLESLHVKNLALIDEVEIDFKDGLNILTGETGAGKSIIIGSINLTLGAKADKDYIRTGAEYALVEIIFRLNEKQRAAVEQMDIPLEEENRLLLQRKIMAGRSWCKANGENIAAGQLKNLAGILLDLYGQHEHQTLLKPSKHKEILDEFAGREMWELKKSLRGIHTEYIAMEKELLTVNLDGESRQREGDLLSFEINEIETASLELGEDEEAERKYRRMVNSRRIKESAYLAHSLTGYEKEGCAGDAVGRALKEIKNVSTYDVEIEPLFSQLTEIDSLLNDFNRSMADYRDCLEFNEEEYRVLEERLNVINHLKSKYGNTIEEIAHGLDAKKNRLDKLLHYEEYVQELIHKVAGQRSEILLICGKISNLRIRSAELLADKLKKAMIDLNFLDVSFRIQVTPEEEAISADGYDKVEYLISVNPGEALKPLQQIASGGELSRIMLAFKSVFADKDETDSLVFDEIDVGISGKTAWMVSEKLGALARNHQIICITHLPQIASMADNHYLISKTVNSTRTVTDICLLEEKESMEELARMLGSDVLSEAALENARAMKRQAEVSKESYH